MRIGRFLVEGTPRTGRLDGDLLYPFSEDSLANPDPASEPISIQRNDILPPCRPSKIVCVGRNYRDHAKERGKPIPEQPLLFLKPPSAALAPGHPIVIPPGTGRVDHEAELALVIGREAKDLAVALAGQVILGYTCFNDVTAREIQDREGKFTRAKGFDTFAPFGPWIETELDPSNLAILGSVNGEVRQSSRTGELIFSPSFLVAFISRVMTLFPGDLIATGTPAGVGPLRDGDRVEVRVEGIGILSNPVQAPGVT